MHRNPPWLIAGSLALTGAALWSLTRSQAPAISGASDRFGAPDMPCWIHVELLRRLHGDAVAQEAAVTYQKASADVIDSCALGNGPMLEQLAQRTGRKIGDLRKEIHAAANALRKTMKVRWGSAIVSPHPGTVQLVVNELQRTIPGRFTAAQHYRRRSPNYNPRGRYPRGRSRNYTEISAPAPFIGHVKAVVARVLRQRPDHHTRVTEHPTPRGVVGGWSLRLHETPGHPGHIH